MEERTISLGRGIYRLRLEEVFWTHLEDFAVQRGVSLDRLVSDIVGDDPDPPSVLRVHVLFHFQALAGFFIELGGKPAPPAGERVH